MNSRRTMYSAVASCAMLCALGLPGRAQAASDSFGGLQYRALGPAISGGRTTAVVGSDRDGLLLYAGGADGGVFKSVDGGASWQPVFDRASAASIGAIAISPRDPDDVWVGTGESNPRNDVESGNGLWHSTDGGKTWSHAGLDDAGQISSISIDPRDPRLIAVGVLGQVFRDNGTRGVYVSRDGGAHWIRTLFAGPSSGISDLVRVPDHPATLFAGVYQFRRQPWTMTSGGPLGGLYRSDDGGLAWRKITGHGFPAGLTGRIGLAAANGGRMYATCNRSTATCGVRTTAA
ncbi:MAG: sialidase family protein [Candidatus Tumulicola sp.]